MLLAGDRSLESLGEAVGVYGRPRKAYAGDGAGVMGERMPMGVRLLRREDRDLDCDCDCDRSWLNMVCSESFILREGISTIESMLVTCGVNDRRAILWKTSVCAAFWSMDSKSATSWVTVMPTGVK